MKRGLPRLDLASTPGKSPRIRHRVGQGVPSTTESWISIHFGFAFGLAASLKVTNARSTALQGSKLEEQLVISQYSGRFFWRPPAKG